MVSLHNLHRFSCYFVMTNIQSFLNSFTLCFERVTNLRRMLVWFRPTHNDPHSEPGIHACLMETLCGTIQDGRRHDKWMGIGFVWLFYPISVTLHIFAIFHSLALGLPGIILNFYLTWPVHSSVQSLNWQLITQHVSWMCTLISYLWMKLCRIFVLIN